jgi:hypothetical protein
MSVPGNLYTPTIRKTRGGDYLIEQSLLFNDDDSAYLSRTPSTVGNRKTWTFSCWVKGLKIAQNGGIFIATDNTSTSIWGIRYTSSHGGTFEVINYPGSIDNQLSFAGLIRDPSAWYHLVVAFDTTQATASNRVKMYLNGTQLTAFVVSTYPALNYEGQINNTVLHTLGTSIWATQYMDGLMALPILVDGAALDPTSFGEEDDDGYWNPIEFTGATGFSGQAFTGGTASASSGTAANAFDNNTATKWATAGEGQGASAWLQYDLGAGNTAHIRALSILTQHGGGVYMWATFKLQYSDNGSTWTDVSELGADTTLARSGTLLMYYEFEETGEHRYWRLQGITAANHPGEPTIVTLVGHTEFVDGYGTNGFQLDYADTAAFGADVKTNTNTMTPTFEAQYYNTSNLTTYTFSACDLGTADADRSIIVAVGAGRVSAGSRTVSSLTIGGVSATFAGRKQTVNLNANEIWYAKVPTGATGDVVVTFNAGMIACGIGIWSVLNLGPVQDVQGVNTSGNIASQSVSIGGGESAFAVFNVYDEGEMTAVSWSTATERYEDLTNETNTRNLMGADYTFSTSSNATTVTATYTGLTGGNDGSLLGVTFGRPNDNFYKANNFTTTDQLSDTPTDSAADGIGNAATWNPLVPYGVNVFAEGNTEVTQPWNGGVHESLGSQVLRGNVYWETEASVIARSRWYTGVSNADLSKYAKVYSFNGDMYLNGSTTGNVASTFVAGDRIGWAYSEDADALWMRINGTWQNGATIGEIESGDTTNAVYSGMSTWGDLFFTSSHGDGLNNTMTSRLYVPEDTWEYTAPSGFTSVSTQNHPATTVNPAYGLFPTIADGSDYFNTVLYTGTGAGQSITGVGFQPDFVWGKARSVAYNHRVYDVVRGATKRLQTDITAAEQTDATELTSFDADGFTVGSSIGLDDSGQTYVAWCWKAGGTAVTNTAGSLTAQVSVNTTSGFSIVTWTGSGANATVGHGHGQVLSMFIIKNRTDASSWPVFHINTPDGGDATPNTLFLDTDAAAISQADYWPGGTSPHIFNVGINNASNGSGDSMVAYCWSEVPGFSKFGSYTGNGSTDGPFVYCGFRPAFVLIKKTSAADNWMMVDAVRDTYNPVYKTLYPHLANAENTGYAGDDLDFLSNGFKIRGVDSQLNSSGGTYIFAAFAENPFQGDVGYTQARAR